MAKNKTSENETNVDSNLLTIKDEKRKKRF